MVVANYYNNKRVPGVAVGLKKSGSSNQRRRTQGREKRILSTLMPWEKQYTKLGANGP